MSVVLFVEVGVVLLSCACVVLVSQTPTGKVTGEPEVAQQLVYMTPRSTQTQVVDLVIEVKERTWILSKFSGDEPWEVVTGTLYLLETLVQKLLRQIATMIENQIKWIRDSRVCCGLVAWVTGCDDCLFESSVTQNWKTELSVQALGARGIELCEKLKCGAMDGTLTR